MAWGGWLFAAGLLVLHGRRRIPAIVLSGRRHRVHDLLGTPRDPDRDDAGDDPVPRRHSRGRWTQRTTRLCRRGHRAPCRRCRHRHSRRSGPRSAPPPSRSPDHHQFGAIECRHWSWSSLTRSLLSSVLQLRRSSRHRKLRLWRKLLLQRDGGVRRMSSPWHWRRSACSPESPREVAKWSPWWSCWSSRESSPSSAPWPTLSPISPHSARWTGFEHSCLSAL